MTPSNHTHKTNPQGCPICSIENRQYKTGWTDTEWKLAGINSNYFDSFKLYIIQCKNNEETFIKIGKTFRKTQERFRSKTAMPYKYEVLNEIVQDADQICQLEKDIHNKLKEYKYSPKISFGGSYFECFSISVDEINQLLKGL